MNKEEFVKKIKEAESDFYKNNPCYHCVGNGCDDCRGCEDAVVSHRMEVEIRRLKNEYKTEFGVDYDEERQAIIDAKIEKARKEKEKARKEIVLKEVYANCTLSEILQFGFEQGKVPGILMLTHEITKKTEE